MLEDSQQLTETRDQGMVTQDRVFFSFPSLSSERVNFPWKAIHHCLGMAVSTAHLLSLAEKVGEGPSGVSGLMTWPCVHSTGLQKQWGLGLEGAELQPWQCLLRVAFLWWGCRCESESFPWSGARARPHGFLDPTFSCLSVGTPGADSVSLEFGPKDKEDDSENRCNSKRGKKFSLQSFWDVYNFFFTRFSSYIFYILK